MKSRLQRRALRAGVLAGFAVSWGGSVVTAQEPYGLSGVVLEEGTDRPLSGATVVLVGSDLASETGSEGEFLLAELARGTVTLRVSLEGYASLVEPLFLSEGTETFVQLHLLPLAVAVQEIIATVPGSTPSVAAAPLRSQADDPRTAADLLQGRMAGVNLNRNQGSAGGGARVQTRGVNSISLANEPLFYLNGVRVSGRMGDMHVLETIPASWVTQIRVLRGPSAQYPDAFNGVVLIETDPGRGSSP